MTRAASQLALFETPPGGGEFLGGLLAYHPALFDEQEAHTLMTQLHAGLDWQQPRVRLFGREVSSPRLAAWYGDPGAVYTYSGLRNDPLPWTKALTEVRRRVEAAAGTTFNSVLANLYRDGDDAMGWHSDDEAELDPGAPIASLSLGCVRRFRLQHRRRRQARLELPLASGSLLVMHAPMQREWRHALPRDRRVTGPRINLTFRRVS